ncbi:MAG: M28 family metallopeptidase [Terriglobales bacterium]
MQPEVLRGRRYKVYSLAAVFSLIITALLVAQNPSVVLQPVAQDVITQRLQRLHAKDGDRETELKTMFGEAGCTGDQVQEETVKHKDPSNVICTLPGSANSVIVVGAHFDHADEGMGAIDDWSGASLLPSLFQALKASPRKHTFVFVGFTDEEKGLLGSNFYVGHLSKEQLSAVKAVVNLECLGLTPTKVWAHTANRDLLADLLNVSRSMNTTLQGVDVDQVGDDDTHAFRDRKVPVITIHSTTQETWPLLHSRKDNLTAINLDYLYESYHVVAVYLAYIDQALK